MHFFRYTYINVVSVVFIIALQAFTHNTISLYGQAPRKYTSGEIYQKIEKLGFLGSVLYVAAHPDDENTRMISYLANERKAHTTYLSLTRGDGGQNLIGTEINEFLGVLRTQELLMARSVDNGNQMFTRANDFGYSKNAEETIKIWDTEKVKADVVWAMRKTRPDVIINRFDHRTSGETHGHHTASAMLSMELFEKAADSAAYPEQLAHVRTWLPRRLFFNISWWFYGSEEKFRKADKSNFMSMDLGTYYPLLGKSNTEIAAESRSRHKCQGFGSTGTRGSQIEYLELLKGDLPPNRSDVFEGINTSWTRVGNGEKVKELWDNLKQNYDFRNPSKSLADLIRIHRAIQLTDDPFWKELKSREVLELIEACSGMFLEAKANVHKLVAGESTTVDFEIISRSFEGWSVSDVKGKGFQFDSTFQQPLSVNEPLKWSSTITIPDDTPLTAPYWLTETGTLGLYQVNDQQLIGKPETPRSLKVVFTLKTGDDVFSIEKEVVYKFNSPENGETYRPLEIVPAFSVACSEPVYIFADQTPKEIKVIVHGWAGTQKGKLSIPLPKDWKIAPKFHDVETTQKGESREFIFTVTPPQTAQEFTITPVVETSKALFNAKITEIKYDHIPHQTVVMQAKSKLSRIEISTKAKRIAYVMGAGDELPKHLRQIGCIVDELKADEITAEKLASYEALVVGVRAYNTEEALKFKQPAIFEYCSKGGTVIVQYNTSGGMVTKELAPYPLTISRARVSVEEAEMKILTPDHPLLNFPNRINKGDFDGWVQERGLYFPGEWDPAFTPVFSCNDPNEKEQQGSLLIATYGKGHYIYTGLSFFRQLPAGVSGAYRLFSNLISIGANAKP